MALYCPAAKRTLTRLRILYLLKAIPIGANFQGHSELQPIHRMPKPLRSSSYPGDDVILTQNYEVISHPYTGSEWL